MMTFCRLLMVGTLLASSGCANLVVRKTSGRDPIGDDHVKGFRYYLPRPYVLVTEPILVAEETGLYVTTARGKNPASNAVEEIKRSGDKGALARVNPLNNVLEPVPAAEWETLKKAITDRPDIVLTSFGRHKAPPPSVSVNVDATTAPRLTDVPADGRALTSDVVHADVRDGIASTADNGPAADDVTPSTTKTADLKGKIKVVFLPDFEEQYAVHPKNVMAKLDYQLKFVDGWQLGAVSADLDSTTVALKLIEVVNTAIDSAKKLGLARLSVAGGPSGAEKIRPRVQIDKKFDVYQRIARTYIVPGIYRINKPWESDGPPPVGTGMLVHLGLRTVTVEEWQPAPAVARPASTASTDCCPAKE